MQIGKANQLQVEVAATHQAVTAAKELYKYAKLEASFTENGLGWAQLLAREELKKFPKLQDDGHSLTAWSPRSFSLRVVLARDPHGLLTAFVFCVCMQSSAGRACAKPRCLGAGTLVYSDTSREWWKANAGTFPQQAFDSAERRARRHWDPREGWAGFVTVGSGESAVRMPRKVAARNDFYAYDFEMDWGFNELGEPRALMKEDARCQKKNAAGKVAKARAAVSFCDPTTHPLGNGVALTLVIAGIAIVSRRP